MRETEKKEMQKRGMGGWLRAWRTPFEPLVVLRGQNEMTVYGCRRILLYTAKEIRLLLRKRQLCVMGEELLCASFSGGAITVEGMIALVRYEPMTQERIET